MFLSELNKMRNTLKEAKTVVTSVDGKKFVETKTGQVQLLNTNSCGFVVDMKPDNIPVMVVENLYIGSQDCTADDILKSYNIKHVISLGVNAEITEEIQHTFVEFLDLPETDIKPALTTCLPHIHKAIESYENVLVHCNAGVSRTATVAIAYLMCYKRMDFKSAYDLVKEKRPAIHPNVGFAKQLQIVVFEDFATVDS